MTSVLEIVKDYTNNPPVNIKGLIERLRIEYSEQEMGRNESGRIEKTDGGFKIVVNSKENEQRQRFTAAHELAHYLLHRDMLDYGSLARSHLDRLFDDGENPPAPFSPAHEVQANKLAAQLLMPTSPIRKMKDEGISIADLAKKFNVSCVAMEIRLKVLGLSES